MKKRIFILLFSLLLIPFVVNALDEKPVLNDYLYLDKIGEGVSDHNVFVGGDNVAIDKGTYVDGILFGAGKDVTVDGSSDYVVLAGSSIEINNTINNDVFAAGSKIRLDKNISVGGDLYLAGDDITISGYIDGNVFVAADTIRFVNCDIQGKVKTAAATVNFGSEVKIRGNISISDKSKVNDIDDAIIDGEVIRYKDYNTEFIDIRYNIFAEIVVIISLIIIAALLDRLFPRFMLRADDKESIHTYLATFGWGLVGLICLPILLAILSLLLFPLGLVGFALWLICIFISVIPTGTKVASVLIEKIFNKKIKTFNAAAIGIIFLELVMLIPYVGVWVTLISIIYGNGYILRSLIKKGQKKDA